MKHGYFAALSQSMYRETRDGRRVIRLRRLPLITSRYFLVPVDARDAFERRVRQAHVAVLLATAASPVLFGDPDARAIVLFFGAMFLIVFPAMQAWMPRGLSPVRLSKADLEPTSRSARQMDYARTAGPATLSGLMVLSVMLTILPVYVLLTDGVWWAWLAVSMFGALVVHFGWLLLRLRAEARG